MTKSAQQKIVHESETQRQYVRVPIPARVKMNDREFTVKDLSSGGIGIADIEGEFEKGGTLSLTLTFPFPDFALDMNLDTQIQNYAPDEKLLGVRFINLSPAQISTVNAIVRAFISGEVISTDDILDISRRNDFVQVRQHKQNIQGKAGTFGTARNIATLALIAFLGLAALYIIFQNIYASSFVVSSNLGVVKAETLSLSTPVPGTYSSFLSAGTTQVENGDEIGRVVFAQGALEQGGTSLMSPCDCIITKSFVRNGQYVAIGAPVLEMVPVDTLPYAEIYIAPQDATRLQINDMATLQVIGTETKFEGLIRDIVFDEAAMQNPATSSVQAIKIIIEPTQPLPLENIGKPVKTTFDLF